ncbi:MAG: SprT protein [Crocinitomix sp.]
MVHFTVSKKRKTKLGDYRHPHNGKPHRISVNGDLNPYSFLITTLHEMAHLTTFEKYGNRIKPHGVHWKTEFKAIADPILNEIALPTDVDLALNNYLRNAKASSCSDDKLYRVLKRYDNYKGITLEELENGSLFKLNAKTFVKGKKLRTRFECVEVGTHKKYRVLGLAEVEKIESN